MPDFEASYQALRDEGFAIIGVNNSETVAQVQQFREDLGLTFPLVMDETADIQWQYNIASYPSTFVLNRDGIIVERHFGPITADLLAEKVQLAMESVPAAGE
jgi:peroxiredoxin